MAMTNVVRYVLAMLALGAMVAVAVFAATGRQVDGPQAQLRADAEAVAAALSAVASQRRDATKVEAALAAAARERHLSEAVLFDRRGNVLARAGGGATVAFDLATAADVKRADQGEVVVVSSPDPQRLRALVRLDRWETGTSTYLFVGRPAGP